MIRYNHQKEVRPDLLNVTENIFSRKVKVTVMKKILDRINEFCREYYMSFAERI